MQAPERAALYQAAATLTLAHAVRLGAIPGGVAVDPGLTNLNESPLTTEILQDFKDYYWIQLSTLIDQTGAWPDPNKIAGGTPAPAPAPTPSTLPAGSGTTPAVTTTPAATTPPATPAPAVSNVLTQLGPALAAVAKLAGA